MLVNCFAARKGNGKGCQSGERRLEKGRETDVRNQRDPCCHVWMQQWLRSEKGKGGREWAELCLSGCVALCSLV